MTPPESDDRPMKAWISVGDALPQVGVRSLIYIPAASGKLEVVMFGSYGANHAGEGWWTIAGFVERVTHWMPLPGAPRPRGVEGETVA